MDARTKLQRQLCTVYLPKQSFTVQFGFNVEHVDLLPRANFIVDMLASFIDHFSSDASGHFLRQKEQDTRWVTIDLARIAEWPSMISTLPLFHSWTTMLDGAHNSGQVNTDSPRLTIIFSGFYAYPEKTFLDISGRWSPGGRQSYVCLVDINPIAPRCGIMDVMQQAIQRQYGYNVSCTSLNATTPGSIEELIASMFNFDAG